MVYVALTTHVLTVAVVLVDSIPNAATRCPDSFPFGSGMLRERYVN